MKIATWNLELVRTKYKIPRILEKLKEIDADILILTETASVIDLSTDYFGVQSTPLPDDTIFDTVQYKSGENRTTILSKFPISESISTSNNYTNTCVRIISPFGDLVVYATIVGIIGFRKPFFRQDLQNMITDGNKLARGNSICIAGDFNTSFSDNYFFDGNARLELNSFFENNNLMNLTENIPNNIDHIVVTKDFIKDYSIEIDTWNHDFKLSDHMGVCVNLTKV
ncbi:MAG: endonuclease/exonuclease/phosphatase family protein [Bacteroidia bacterium]